MNRYLPVIFAVALCTSGCFAERGRKFEEAQVSTIQKGQTTRDQIIGLFGEPPNSETRAGGIELLTYQYAFSKTKGVNAVAFIPLIGADKEATKREVVHRTLVVELKKGVVQDYSYSEERKKVGGE